MHSLKIKILFISLFVLITFFLFNEKTAINSMGLIWQKNITLGNTDIRIYDKKYRFEGNLFPVAKLPNGFIVLNERGETVFSTNLEDENEKYSVSSNYYALYEEKPVKNDKLKGRIIRLFNLEGKPINIRKKPPYREKVPKPLNCLISRCSPRVSPSGEIIVLIDSSGMEFSIYSRKLNKIIVQQRSYGPLITCYGFSKTKDFFVVGYVNGVVAAFNSEGKELFNKKIKAGKYNIIKSVFIADDGGKIGVVAGLYPENILVLDNKGKLLWHNVTGYNQKHKIFGSFSAGESERVFVQIPGGITIYSNEDGKYINKIRINRFNKKLKLFDADAGNEGYIVASFTAKDQTVIKFITFSGIVLHKIEFPDSFMFVKLSKSGDLLYLQGDKNILCYRIIF